MPLALIVGLVGAAWSSETLPEEDMLFFDIPVVVGASKHEQRVSDAPASVTIVTTEQIRRFGWRTLGEILEGVRGMHVTRDRNYAFAGMRGFSPPGAYGERTLILLDGLRFNNVLYDGGNVDRNLPIDVADIDRIEIIRGPGSALYGTNALLGVVNIITRRGRDLNGGEAALVGGSYNTLGGHTTWGGRFDNDVEVLVAVGGRWSEGQEHYYASFDRPLRNDGVVEDLDAEWDYDSLAKFGFRDLQFEAYWGTREKEIPTASYGTYFNGQRSFTNETNAGISATLDHQTPTNTDLHASLQLQYYDYFGDYMYNWGSPEDVRLVPSNDQSHSLGWVAEAQVTETLFQGNDLTSGFEFRHTFQMHQKYEDRLPNQTFVYLDRDSPIFNAGLFVQDEWTPVDSFTVTSGVRGDLYPGFGLTLNPRLALVFKPTNSSTVKGLYGTAFRAPNGYERFYDDGGVYNKAPKSLDPEKLRTFELVFEQFLHKTWSTTAAAYHTTMNDLVASTVDPKDNLAVFDNIGTARSIGLEFGAEGHPSWLETRGSVSVHDVRQGDSGDVMPNAPLYLGNAMASPALVPNHLFLGGEVHVVGPRGLATGGRIGSYSVFNLHMLTRDLVGGFHIDLTLRNVLGTEYRHVGGLELRQRGLLQDGRNFRATLGCVF
jgi:outer membrane receptor for ferrienterochelin and colicins